MKKINIKLKKLGKKKIKSLKIELKEEVKNLKDLVTQIIKNEVKNFNERQENPLIVPFLSEVEIKEKEEEGKVSFGDAYNQQKVLENEAIENAILAFTDGLFVVFVDDNEIKNLEENIALNTQSEVVFMRLTFLTGRCW